MRRSLLSRCARIALITLVAALGPGSPTRHAAGASSSPAVLPPLEDWLMPIESKASGVWNIGWPIHMKVADFDEDGAEDLFLLTHEGDFTTGAWTSRALVSRGDGLGHFLAPETLVEASGGAKVIDYSLQGFLATPEVVDIDGDGHCDAAFLLQRGEEDRLAFETQLFVVWGDGDGRFDVQSISLTAGESWSSTLAVSDFDGDGLKEIAIPAWQHKRVLVLSQEPARQFGKPAAIALPDPDRVPIVLASGDFDADGRCDLLVGGYTLLEHNTIRRFAQVLYGDGTGRFAPGIPIDYGSVERGLNRISMAVGHFDDDGMLDFLATFRADVDEMPLDQAGTASHGENLTIFLGREGKWFWPEPASWRSQAGQVRCVYAVREQDALRVLLSVPFASIDLYEWFDGRSERILQDPCEDCGPPAVCDIDHDGVLELLFAVGGMGDTTEIRLAKGHPLP